MPGQDRAKQIVTWLLSRKDLVLHQLKISAQILQLALNYITLQTFIKSEQNTPE